MMTDISTPRIPTRAERDAAQAYRARTANHICFVCADGCADCATIAARDEAADVITAFALRRPIAPCEAWPMMQSAEVSQ